MNMTAPYTDFSAFLRRHFSGKVQKLSLDAGFTCPNRDDAAAAPIATTAPSTPAIAGRTATSSASWRGASSSSPASIRR